MPVRAVQSIFCYAYQAGPEGRGFSVNVYNNDTLAFSLYDERRQMLSEECFTLDRGTHLRILQLIRRAERDWLNSFPTRMARWDTPRHISRIGLDSHALFQLEDLEETIAYGREAIANAGYNESVSTFLRRCDRFPTRQWADMFGIRYPSQFA